MKIKETIISLKGALLSNDWEIFKSVLFRMITT